MAHYAARAHVHAPVLGVDYADCIAPAGNPAPGSAAWQQRDTINQYCATLRLRDQYDVLPRYFVYAGLVFTPLSLDYMRTLGQGWRESANAELTYELYYRRNESPETARLEPIVLASTLAHPANANFKISHHALVDKINGRHIDKLEDVVRAFESATNTHHVIEFVPNHAFETLKRAEADAAQSEILKTYGLPKDRRL